MTIPGVLLALYRYVRPFRLTLIPVLLACLLEMGLTAQLPLSIKYLIDRALVNKDGRALVIILIALAGSAVLVSAAGLGRDHLYARIVAKSIATLRSLMYDKLQHLSLEFYSRRETSEILSRFSNDLHAIDLALVSAVGWGLQPVLDIILSVALIFAFEWRLALIGTLLCPICALGPRLLSRRGMEAAAEKRARDVAVLSIVQETISAPALIQTFSLRRCFHRILPRPQRRPAAREHPPRIPDRADGQIVDTRRVVAAGDRDGRRRLDGIPRHDHHRHVRVVPGSVLDA